MKEPNTVDYITYFRRLSQTAGGAENDNLYTMLFSVLLNTCSAFARTNMLRLKYHFMQTVL